LDRTGVVSLTTAELLMYSLLVPTITATQCAIRESLGGKSRCHHSCEADPGG